MPYQNAKLRLTASASDIVFRGGEKIRLFLDIQLAPGMHVYAPGVEGYIPVAWTLAGSPAVAETAAPVYPPARKLHLAAIDETVPVFENQLRVYRDVTIGGAREVEKSVTEGNVVLEGSFRYQACDATQCYVPEDVPLRWSFRYEPHDPTRVPPELRKLK